MGVDGSVRLYLPPVWCPYGIVHAPCVAPGPGRPPAGLCHGTGVCSRVFRSGSVLGSMELSQVCPLAAS